MPLHPISTPSPPSAKLPSISPNNALSESSLKQLISDFYIKNEQDFCSSNRVLLNADISTYSSGEGKTNTYSDYPQYICTTDAERPYGCVTTIKGNERPYQEDAHCLTSITVDGQTIPLRGVFDGHVGEFVSRFLAEHLGGFLGNSLSNLTHLCNQEKVIQAIKEACAHLDSTIQENTETVLWKYQGKRFKTDPKKPNFTPTKFCNNGSSAAFSLHIDDQLSTANVGDSRAILVRKDGSIIPLTRDHKPTTPDICSEIKAKGGTVAYYLYSQRVNRILAIGRAFGDFHLTNAKGHKVISCEPEVFVTSFNPGDTCLFACDGLWDGMSSSNAGDLLNSYKDDLSLETLTARFAFSGTNSSEQCTTYPDKVTALMFSFDPELA